MLTKTQIEKCLAKHFKLNTNYYNDYAIYRFISELPNYYSSWLNSHVVSIKYAYPKTFSFSAFNHKKDFSFLISSLFSKHGLSIFNSLITNKPLCEPEIKELVKFVNYLEYDADFKQFLVDFYQEIPVIDVKHFNKTGLSVNESKMIKELNLMKKEYDLLGLPVESFIEDNKQKIIQVISELNIYQDFTRIKLPNLTILVPDTYSDIIIEARKIEKMLNNNNIDYPDFNGELTIDNLLAYKNQIIELTKQKLV